MSKIYKVGLLIFLSVLSHLAVAQSGTVSPYSRFGVGDLKNAATAVEFGMGGLSLGLLDSTHIHQTNPANLSNINTTIYQFGMFGQIVDLSSSNATAQRNTSNLNYLALAFPVGKKIRTAFTLSPYSSVGYENTDREIIDSVQGVNYTYLGTGGLNKLQWASSFNVGHGFHLGVTLNYLFGSIDRETVIRYDSTDIHNQSSLFRTSVSDFNVSAGIKYQKKLSNGMRIALGSYYTFGKETNASRRELTYTFTDFSGVRSIKDTVINKASEGNLVLPSSFGIGASMYLNEKWMVGAEFSGQDWSNYESFGDKDSLQNSYRISVGTAYTPNYRAIKSYYKRMTYRMGFRYEQGYLSLRDVSLDEYGISFGLSMPLRNSRNSFSEINFGFEYAVRGATTSNLIQENYYRFKLGIVLNDKWFAKRKID